MFCYKCGKEIDEGAKFCDYCGAKLDDSYIPNEPDEHDAEVNNTNDYSSTENRSAKKRSPYLIPIIVGAIVFVLALIGVVVWLTSDKDDNAIDESNSQKEEIITTESDPVENEPEEELDLAYIPEGAEIYDGHYYVVFDEPIYWDDAKASCESMGGHLATITSQGEQDFVANLIENNGDKKNYWLGGTDVDDEGKWVWITGEDWTYSNWREGQPNDRDNDDTDGDQDYLQIGCGSQDEDRYMKWWDMSNSGVSYGYEDYPNYKDTQFFGYVCEWDGTE